MKVLVLGGGVIGCTAAYELAGDGHEVTLVERQPGAALETSYANAGEVSPGYSAPWAGPGEAAGVPSKPAIFAPSYRTIRLLPPVMLKSTITRV